MSIVSHPYLTGANAVQTNQMWMWYLIGKHCFSDPQKAGNGGNWLNYQLLPGHLLSVTLCTTHSIGQRVTQSVTTNPSKIELTPAAWYHPYCHRRNTPSAKLLSLTALIVSSLHLFAEFPTPARVLLSRGLSGGSSKPSTHCSRQPLKPPW